MAKPNKHKNYAIFAGDELIEDNFSSYKTAKDAANDYAVNLLPKNRKYGKINVRDKAGVKIYETEYKTVKE